jgi:hypothetical protein
MRNMDLLEGKIGLSPQIIYSGNLSSTNHKKQFPSKGPGQRKASLLILLHLASSGCWPPAVVSSGYWPLLAAIGLPLYISGVRAGGLLLLLAQ